MGKSYQLHLLSHSQGRQSHYRGFATKLVGFSMGVQRASFANCEGPTAVPSSSALKSHLRSRIAPLTPPSRGPHIKNRGLQGMPANRRGAPCNQATTLAGFRCPLSARRTFEFCADRCELCSRRVAP